MGIHVHFLKASADFQKTYGGHPGRDEMAGRLHGELYAFSSRARDVNTCTHTCTNRVELSPG